MSRIELAPEISEDFARILDHQARHQVEQPQARSREIIEALDVLEHNPLIGRPLAKGKRELVIGRRWRVFIALFSFLASPDFVLLLALRCDREAGYAERSG